MGEPDDGRVCAVDIGFDEIDMQAAHMDMGMAFEKFGRHDRAD